MRDNDTNDGFFSRVYEVVKKIPCGKVCTYGIIAKTMNAPRCGRQVGFALHANPDQKTIPCHRVVNRFGALSSAFVFGGQNMQKILLMNEGVEVRDDMTVDLNKFLVSKL